jgi:hypothetical protein
VPTDSDHNLLVAEVQTRLKAIKKIWEGETKMEFKKMKNKENHMREMIEQNFSQIDGVTGSTEDNWGKQK